MKAGPPTSDLPQAMLTNTLLVLIAAHIVGGFCTVLAVAFSVISAIIINKAVR
jgi:hypothetical protein